MRKVNILLQAIERLGKDVEYYAVDLSLPELKRTFAEIPTGTSTNFLFFVGGFRLDCDGHRAFCLLQDIGASEGAIIDSPNAKYFTEGYKHVKCFGLYGTYDHALEWLKSSQISTRPKTILWLGSSLGNFKRHEVPPFLAGFCDAVQPGDTMLIGIDSCKDPDRVFHAYNDRENVTHEFTLNGLKHANRIIGKTVFKPNEWEAIGEYDEMAGRHHAFVSPKKDVEIDSIPIAEGERIRIEESYKYSREEIQHLWQEAGLMENSVWSNSKGDYGTHSLPSHFLDFLMSISNSLQAFTWSPSPYSSFRPNRRTTLHSLPHPSLNGASSGPPGTPSLAR